MCPPLFRFVLLPCILCLLLLVLQQRCLSAALKSSSSAPSPPHDDDDDDDDGVEDGGEVVRVEGRDSNISRTTRRHGGKRRRRRMEDKFRMLENEMRGMQRYVKKIRTLETQMREMQKYVSTLQREKCAKHLCPMGSMKYGCDCLMYVHRAMDWGQAANYCAGMTGTMVAVTSHGINKHIKAFLKAQLGRRGVEEAEVYTGLIYTTRHSRTPSSFSRSMEHRIGGADGWYWHNLTHVTKLLPKDSHHWAQGYPPSPKNSSAPFPRSCVILKGSVGLKWVTTHCSTPKNFICHFRAVPARNRRRKGRRRRKKKKKKKTERDGLSEEEQLGGGRNSDEEELENG